MKLKSQKPAAPKPNKDGWIRNRGGKCPVEDEVYVDMRFRDGSIHSNHAGYFRWGHIGLKGDIMSYRIHTPATEPTTTHSPMPTNTPITLRDRAHAITAEIATHNSGITALQAERADVLRQLREMGFELVAEAQEPVKPEEDMSDPKNWRVGDRFTVTDCMYGHEFEFEDIVTMEAHHGDVMRFTNGERSWSLSQEELKFHSRPQ